MCERTGEVASYVVARYYEVEKGENHEMVEGTSWMVRWKAVGKAVSTYAQSRRGSKSSSSERASGNSHPCPIQPYTSGRRDFGSHVLTKHPSMARKIGEVNYCSVRDVLYTAVTASMAAT